MMLGVIAGLISVFSSLMLPAGSNSSDKTRGWCLLAFKGERFGTSIMGIIKSEQLIAHYIR